MYKNNNDGTTMCSCRRTKHKMHRQTVWRTLKSNTLGASSTVYTNDLVKYQSATILTGLQGRLKGLNVSPSVACNCYGLSTIPNPI